MEDAFLLTHGREDVAAKIPGRNAQVPRCSLARRRRRHGSLPTGPRRGMSEHTSPFREQEGARCAREPRAP